MMGWWDGMVGEGTVERRESCRKGKEREGKGKRRIDQKKTLTLSHSNGSPSSLAQTTHTCGTAISTGCRGISENLSFGRARNSVVFCPAAILRDKNNQPRHEFFLSF
jgi:hypothetical protein